MNARLIRLSWFWVGFMTVLCSAATAREQLSVSPVSKQLDKPLAELRNERVKISFVTCERQGKSSVTPVFQVRTKDGWHRVAADASAESYQVLQADPDLKMDLYHVMHPKWKAVKALKLKDGITKVVWNAGENHEAIVKSAKQDGPNRVVLSFHQQKVGVLQAIWELAPGDRSAKVELKFTATQAAQYSLGYFMPNRKPIEQVDELLMPMLVQRKRFPAENYTQLQAAAPTPLSLMQTTDAGHTFSWGVSGDPSQVPFEFPVPIKSHYGLHIKNEQGHVQPSIYGPLPGTERAKFEAGETASFTLRVFVQNADWYGAYRDIADNVFGWHDYRKNGEVSMTQSVYNMIDLYMDDEFGGWWERAKANYQIESKNGSTQSSPLTIASLYRLTGNEELYKKRTIPTLEYILSRDNPHFSPEPEDTGGYNRGHMKGPVDIFGSVVYAGLWEMMNHRTPVFKDIAFPGGGLKPTTRQQGFVPHVQPFDDQLAKYLYTRDEAALEKAMAEADAYIENVINKAPKNEIALREFFLMAYTPDWEGLLALYETTGKQRYLDAAEKGARVVMTGMWTQPMPKDESITIHEGGHIHGDKMNRWLHRGEKEFRLGFPRKKGDVKEKQVPAWLVSNAGLGFEQPSTYTFKDNGGRLILQANWTGGFLRLAQHTGDKQFETYARNAALARMGNYAGYYYTTFTDLMQNPRYPYEGPDIGFVYFHHLPVHLSWTIDYLVGEAQLATDGEVKFPGLRQFGYAYFDNMVYGHAPGKIYGNDDAWLWFDKDLVTLDNEQINYLTAQSGDKFFLIMMNESQEAQTVNVAFNAQAITGKPVDFKQARIISAKNSSLDLANNQAEMELEARGMRVLEISGLNIEVATHKSYSTPNSNDTISHLAFKCDDGTEVRAAAIQIIPGDWQAYIYSTAESKTLKKITLKWKTKNDAGTVVDTDYPYEFSVPVAAGTDQFSFSVQSVNVNGKTVRTPELSIGLPKEAKQNPPKPIK